MLYYSMNKKMGEEDAYSRVLDGEHRDIVKQAFNAMIQADTQLWACPEKIDIEKKYITNATVSSYLSIIVQKMKNDNFVPDIVVGLSRGGLPPGIMMSHYLNKPFIPFETALRDFPVWKSNTTALKSAKKVSNFFHLAGALSLSYDSL